MSRLQAVKETTLIDAAEQPAPPPATNEIATKMLLMALTALGQRFVVALASLFTLLTAASAFFLWYIALPTLDPTKIMGLTIYSAFILILNIYRGPK